MNRLLDISDTLAATMQAQTDFEIRLKNQKLDLEARQLAITPAEGWDGKNAELREAAQKRAFAADPVCQRITAEILGYEEELARLENCVNALTNERRALEWTIRAKLVEAITGNVITVLESHQNVEDTAFDDYTDEVADARLEEKFSENGHEPYPPEESPITWGFPVAESAIPYQLAQVGLNGNGNGGGIAEEEDISF